MLFKRILHNSSFSAYILQTWHLMCLTASDGTDVWHHTETYASGCFSAPAPLLWVFGSDAYNDKNTFTFLEGTFNVTILSRLCRNNTAAFVFYSFCHFNNNSKAVCPQSACDLYCYTTHNHIKIIINKLLLSQSYAKLMMAGNTCPHFHSVLGCTWLIWSRSAGGARVAPSRSSGAECSSLPALSCSVGCQA